jgi:hypothetical protein
MNTTNEYHEQANKFLQMHGIKFRATLKDTKTPAWKQANEKSGHHYRVTLSKPGKRIVFDFWGSIADAESGKKNIHAYEVLACISGEINCPESFEDFCAEYGYESDSIRALQTFRRCNAFAKRLRAFFADDEAEKLSEIA